MDEGGAGARFRYPTLDLVRVKAVSALGRGAKGVVFLAQDRVSGDSFALKAISKALIDAAGGYGRVGFEQRVVSAFRHPLLPTLRGVFESEKLVGHAIDYCPGPDLHSLRKKQTEKMFSDDIIRFYAAEIVLALEYLHGLGIVYRDLKPDNVMIQENGHLMLIDFDLSTKLLPQKSPQTHQVADPVTSSESDSPDRNRSRTCSASLAIPRPFYKCCGHSGVSPDDLDSDSNRRPVIKTGSGSVQVESGSPGKANSFVGTEDYVAPEVITGDGHDFAADWWSLGVVLYEMLYGTTPFTGTNRKETFYRILVKEPDLVGETTPLRDLIRALLVKDPNRRISVAGIKGHDFFKGVNWDLILRIGRPPFVPISPEIDDVEGSEGIDLEAFVEGVFREKIEEKNENRSVQNDNDNDNDNNLRKRVWVEGVSRKQDFSIF